MSVFAIQVHEALLDSLGDCAWRQIWQLQRKPVSNGLLGEFWGELMRVELSHAEVRAVEHCALGRPGQEDFDVSRGARLPRLIEEEDFLIDPIRRMEVGRQVGQDGLGCGQSMNLGKLGEFFDNFRGDLLCQQRELVGLANGVVHLLQNPVGVGDGKNLAGIGRQNVDGFRVEANSTADFIFDLRGEPAIAPSHPFSASVFMALPSIAKRALGSLNQLAGDLLAPTCGGRLAGEAIFQLGIREEEPIDKECQVRATRHWKASGELPLEWKFVDHAQHIPVESLLASRGVSRSRRRRPQTKALPSKGNVLAQENNGVGACH